MGERLGFQSRVVQYLEQEDMNIALIIAGGSGNRMGQDIPKQFMHVDDCPIIIHTMMCFQNHPDIQGIAVVPEWLGDRASIVCKPVQHYKIEVDIPRWKHRHGVHTQWYLWIERGWMRGGGLGADS